MWLARRKTLSLTHARLVGLHFAARRFVEYLEQERERLANICYVCIRNSIWICGCVTGRAGGLGEALVTGRGDGGDMRNGFYTRKQHIAISHTFLRSLLCALCDQHTKHTTHEHIRAVKPCDRDDSGFELRSR